MLIYRIDYKIDLYILTSYPVSLTQFTYSGGFFEDCFVFSMYVIMLSAKALLCNLYAFFFFSGFIPVSWAISFNTRLNRKQRADFFFPLFPILREVFSRLPLSLMLSESFPQLSYSRLRKSLSIPSLLKVFFFKKS